MQKNYVIDKVLYNMLDVMSQEHYGKLWYCHMKNFPNIPDNLLAYLHKGE